MTNFEQNQKAVDELNIKEIDGLIDYIHGDESIAFISSQGLVNEDEHDR